MSELVKAEAPEVEWFTLPGLVIDESILTSDDNETSPQELLEVIKEIGIEVTFMKNDVFSIQGNDKFTCVITNRLKPVWYFMAVDVNQFRKEFFK